MSEWITTGRLPTGDDADEYGDVWHSGSGCVGTLRFHNVRPNDIWQPKQKIPEPYVHPKTRAELVQDLLDAVDVWLKSKRMDDGYLVSQAREKLR